MPFKPGQSGNPKTQFKPGQSGNPGGKRGLTDDDRDAMDVLQSTKVDAAKLLASAVRGKRVSPVALQAARDVLDRTEGRPIQRVVSAEVQSFVALLPAKIEDPDEWEREAERVLGSPVIDVSATPAVDQAKPLEVDPDVQREKKAPPRPLDPTQWSDPALDRNPERDRALGRMPPLTKYHRN